MDLLELGEVFRLVSLELLDAGFAAEFNLLAVVDFDDGFSHRAQFLATDETDFERIGSIGGGEQAGTGEEEAGEKNKCQFH